MSAWVTTASLAWRRTVCCWLLRRDIQKTFKKVYQFADWPNASGNFTILRHLRIFDESSNYYLYWAIQCCSIRGVSNNKVPSQFHLNNRGAELGFLRIWYVIKIYDENINFANCWTTFSTANDVGQVLQGVFITDASPSNHFIYTETHGEFKIYRIRLGLSIQFEI